LPLRGVRGVYQDVKSGTVLPDWLVRIAGGEPLLFVAPHGGRSSRPAALEEPSRKVNDLHTAELTIELANRLNASAIVNRGEDRNRIDLNRVADVRKSAPWFIDLLLEDVRRQIAEAAQATLLFIHGWNAIQPCCDIGIGARFGGGAFVPVKQGVPTVPRRFLPRLARFADACRRGGIHVTVGDRYPAAGRDNVLQLFTARFADDLDPRVRELARLGAAGKIAAVQIELAVPLRWPGALRTRLVEAVATFAESGPSDAMLTLLEAAEKQSVAPEQLALEFHDGEAGVGGFAAAERLATGRRQGRFRLCIGATRLGLFTGEDARSITGDRLHCAGLAWTRGAEGGVTLEYEGPCLTFPRTDPFLDLEFGLSEAELSQLEAKLEWRPTAAAGASGRHARIGLLEGLVRHDGWTATIRAAATLEDGRRADPRRWRERRALSIPLGPDSFLSMSSHIDGDERVEGEILRDGRIEPLLSGRVSVRNSAGGLAPQALRVEVVSRSGGLRVFGQVTHAVPVVRPAAGGRVLTFFGLARFGAGGRVGFGTFEQSQRLGGETKGTEP
jgi:hypothetical protein